MAERRPTYDDARFAGSGHLLIVRPYLSTDADALWSILEPVIRAGEAYALPRDWSRQAALDYWTAPAKAVFVAELDGVIVGTFYLQPNQLGGGDHVANCGYMTRQGSSGRGIAAAMCEHSLDEARRRDFRAMQFNFVIASNVRAVALWQRMGFAVLAAMPAAFRHPELGMVDALMMHRAI
jgi:ribosomal protein S18 acetylase RimI-like enzyme